MFIAQGGKVRLCMRRLLWQPYDTWHRDNISGVDDDDDDDDSDVGFSRDW